MTPDQIRHLKKQAHHLKPVVVIGHQGVTDAVIEKTEEGLAGHELIKIRFNDHKRDKQSMAETLSRSTKSILIAIVGHTAIFYRENPDSENRKI